MPWNRGEEGGEDENKICIAMKRGVNNSRKQAIVTKHFSK
jgi:hypothetical protein